MNETLYAFRRNLVVAASAGTGKTYALVGVMVHLLLGASELGGEGLRDPIDPARIVATTFSRKAAAEVRARVVDALERLASGDASAAYRADLAAACVRNGLDPWSDRVVAERARRALERIGRAQIGTLHGFASSIARRFALELGLPPSLTLEDDDETRTRARDAIERVVGERFDADDATLRAFVRAAGGAEPLVDQIAQTLERLAEDGRGPTELVVAANDATMIEARVEAIVDAARAIVSEAKLGPCASSLVTAFDRRDESAIGPALIDLVGQARRGKQSDAAAAFFELRDDLPSGGTNADRGRALLRLYASRGSFEVHARAARDLLAACETAIREDGRRASALGFGDLLRAARDVLRDHPETAAELGAELDVLLVDEFQDTSRLQRELVQLVWEQDPSAREPGATASISDVRRHGLFVVGDRKQSIYAFRGADVGVFAALCVGLAGEPARRALGIPEGIVYEPETPAADFIALRHNRRSADEVLEFANAFSARRLQPAVPPPQIYEIAYAPELEDLLPPPDRAPTETRVDRATWLRVTMAERRKASSAIDEAYAIAERVQTVVANGGAATRWRDCAVLAESNAMLDATAFALAQAGVPYVVAGSGFHAAREVRDVLALLAVIVRDADGLALLTVLRGPWASVHDDTLIALTDPHRGLVQPELWARGDRRARIHPDDRETIARVGDVVERLRAQADALGAAATLREAVRALAFEEVLVQLPRGAQRVANVRKLIQMAERSRTARAFLDTMRAAANREARETEGATFSDDDDAVRLLTVHASKGLAFPIVFVPEVGKGARSRDRGVFVIETRGDDASILGVKFAPDADAPAIAPPSYDHAIAVERRRERAERARLAYVAITRAERALYLVGDRRLPRAGASEAYATTNAAVLAAIAEDSSGGAPPLVVEPITPTSPRRDASFASVVAPPVAELAPLAASWRSLPVVASAFQDFAHCPRRFQLVTVVELPEPGRVRVAVPNADLVSDGAYADRVRAEGARVVRDRAFAVRVALADAREIVVRGSFDWLVEWPDGAVDVIDAAHARVASADAYDDLLAIHELAARALAPNAPAVRAGIVVAGENAEPTWRAPSAASDVAARIASLGPALAEARWSERFPRVAVSRCHAIRCGYVALCHPDAR